MAVADVSLEGLGRWISSFVEGEKGELLASLAANLVITKLTKFPAGHSPSSVAASGSAERSRPRTVRKDSRPRTAGSWLELGVVGEPQVPRDLGSF